MNNNDNSLLNFLKKKSLFQHSPTKNLVRRRSKSKSKDGRDSIIRKINDNDIEDQAQAPRLNHNNSEKHLRKNLNSFGLTDEFKNEYLKNKQEKPEQKITHRGDERMKSNGQKNPQSNFNLQFQTHAKLGSNNFWTGIIQHSSSFESARVQSAQCLQTLSLKVSTQISNINYRVDQFRSNMIKILSNELKIFRDKLLLMVDEAFKTTEKNIKNYMKLEEEKLASEVLKIRKNLEEEYIHIETLKEDINKPQWRKVAGELLSTDLQNQINQLVKQASVAEIGRWQMKDFDRQNLKSLELELKNLVRLKQ